MRLFRFHQSGRDEAITVAVVTITGPNEATRPDRPVNAL